MKKQLFILMVFLAFCSCNICAGQDTGKIVAKVKDNSIDESANVDILPEFPGGMDAMSKYISKNIKYPKAARKAGIEGRVYIQFTVDSNGYITDVNVQKGIGGGCDEEALRVIKNMPRWKPGTQSGKAVKVKHIVPIKFTLEESKKDSKKN